LQYLPNGFAGLTYNALYCILSGSKRVPQSCIQFPSGKIPETGFLFSDSQKRKEKWHNLRSNYMRERRKSKEKTSGSGATLKGK